MKGFLVICYDNVSSGVISTETLENKLKRKGIQFSKNRSQNNVYQNIYGYQLFKGTASNNKIKSDSPIFIAGDLYGLYKDNNTKLLSYNESVEFIDKSCFYKDYVDFEGNSCVCQITQEEIIIQNDIEGYRKLFYFRDKEIFCVATSLPLILHVINRDWRLRKNAIVGYLCGRESKWPLTFVEDIKVLPPLSRAIVSESDIEITSKIYSDFYNIEKINREELSKQLYDNLELIIKRKRSSNTAVTLSGGYDSNCLTKLYTNVYGNNFTAVSVGYEAIHERGTNINDETVYAERISNKLGIPFRKYRFNKEQFFNEIDNFIDAIDQPGHDPSSNFIMNKYLRSDGFDLVVNGMGGDANFADKSSLSYGFKLNQLRKHITPFIFDLFGRAVRYRGPFRFFRPYQHLKRSIVFHDLFERNQIFKNPVFKYVNPICLNEIDQERFLRNSYFNRLYDNASTEQEIFYSLALFCSPDEFHALSMAEGNEIDILMPFVNTKICTAVMNGSHFNKIINREFEMKLFGGIDKDLLAKKKSGFSIPYAEWVPSISDTVFDFFSDIILFSNDDFNFELFRDNYKNDINTSKSNFANILVWKLHIVQEYIKKYELILD